MAHKRKLVIKNKKRFILSCSFLTIGVILVVITLARTSFKPNNKEKEEAKPVSADPIVVEVENNNPPEEKKLNDWRIMLVNINNLLPEDYEVELADIDEYRKFDKRAIKYLNQMLKDMRNSGITNVWVQSAYRSIKDQQTLYDNSIKKYINQGKTKKEAEELTLQLLNKPGASDHNLGLAVDLNYVKEDFDQTQGYKWLQHNAEKYGFILRYPKDKEKETGIKYEPWHWRYVGEEHAKKMNNLNMCLEEYVEYLKKQ